MIKHFWMLALLCAGAVEAGTLSIKPQAKAVTPNESFSLAIQVNSIDDLYAYQFDLAFDPSVIQAVSVTQGDYLSGGGPTLFFPGTIDNLNGFISATAESLQGASGLSGSGVLASVNFQTIRVGSTPIELQNVFLLASDLSGIVADTPAGSVTVTPEPAYGWGFGVFAAAWIMCRSRERFGPSVSRH